MPSQVSEASATNHHKQSLIMLGSVDIWRQIELRGTETKELRKQRSEEQELHCGEGSVVREFENSL
jgi:hypothetical protein